MFSDHRLIAVREEADEVVGVAHFGRFHDLGERQVFASHGQIFADSSREEGFLSPDAGDFRPQGIESHARDVLSINLDLPHLRVDESRQH